ncbi:hypothetical protein RchiOBHm_Chr4g0424681 [Rosa chinensis]|uniref:Uncharacterized protein n=1 Tax=Rosa chinensis TaxID=74649 RepID=A0A2P6QYX1_ROSCH|nr:hypothetical protein RchiOBHm_Chr4g0424681 [Rosa chinensis]
MKSTRVFTDKDKAAAHLKVLSCLPFGTYACNLEFNSPDYNATANVELFLLYVFLNGLHDQNGSYVPCSAAMTCSKSWSDVHCQYVRVDSAINSNLSSIFVYV